MIVKCPPQQVHLIPITVRRTLETYSLSSLEMYSTALLTVASMWSVTSQNNWKYVAFDPSSPISLTPHQLQTHSHQSSLCICEFSFWGLWFSFKDCTWRWDHTVLVSLSLSRTIMPSGSIHIVKKSRIAFFLWLNVACVCVCVCVEVGEGEGTPSCLYHLSISECLACIHVSAAVNGAVANIWVQISVQKYNHWPRR